MAEENITPQGEASPGEVEETTDATATEAPETQDADTQDAASQDEASSQDEAPARDEQLIVPQPELNEALSASSNAPAEDAPRKEVEGGREYEIIFITRAGDPEATDAAVSRLNELVDRVGGAVDNVRTSEVRRLAYTIDKEIEGVYTVANARFAAANLPEVDRFFKLEEAVLRHMILRAEA